MSTSEASNPIVLDMCIKLMSTLVKYVYYGVKDVKKYQYLVDKIKAIRSFNDIKNKRIKFILAEIVVNVENLIKSFKPINNTISNTKLTAAPQSIILKNKEQLI
jgi:CCR4-NOT transcriptional regulation complex NOT5 subunit